MNVSIKLKDRLSRTSNTTDNFMKNWRINTKFVSMIAKNRPLLNHNNAISNARQ